MTTTQSLSTATMFITALSFSTQAKTDSRPSDRLERKSGRVEELLSARVRKIAHDKAVADLCPTEKISVILLI